ncbi:hypothetical protein OYC64_002650 [Pagothenia borchgrevinki]|uniref:phospholipase A2 n=1 Tax=Pagothenia borchgrevinki TaxID=8213 RepID=A0ABD2HCG7_PAGBO
MLLAADTPCALASSSAQTFKRTRRDVKVGKTRRKRAWIFPGTLWCGTGSQAVRYDQLGMFESADRCCREHDHCLHVIPSFTMNYGVFNRNLYTVSHCDCDQRFRQCLLSVNDSISSMVGYSFFSILRVPCFELKQKKHCTQLYWWGTCKVSQSAPYAVLESPLPYTSEVTSKKGDHIDSNVLTGSKGQSFVISPHRKTPKMATTRTLRLKKKTETPKRDTTKIIWSTATSARPVTTKLKKAASVNKNEKPKKLKDFPLLQNNTSGEPMGSTRAQSTHAERRPKQDNVLHNVTDNQLLCESLKYLDECKYKIRPLKKKFDLQNNESKTAYHCDCTSRLAVQIESFEQPSILPTLLMDFVSQYCFKLPKEKKCHSRNRCSGGFSKASDLLQAVEMMEEKDTARVRNSGSERRRGIPVRLYKRCLRLQREANVMVQLTRL